MNDIAKMIKLMEAMIEINAGKSIDQSIADGTLQQDVKSAHERFRRDSEKSKEEEEND